MGKSRGGKPRRSWLEKIEELANKRVKMDEESMGLAEIKVHHIQRVDGIRNREEEREELLRRKIKGRI